MTAAGLDSGLIIATIIIFFAITFPDVNIPQWWGNVGVFETKVSETCDFLGICVFDADLLVGLFVYRVSEDGRGGRDVWTEDLVDWPDPGHGA